MGKHYHDIAIFGGREQERKEGRKEGRMEGGKKVKIKTFIRIYSLIDPCNKIIQGKVITVFGMATQ